MPNLESVTKPAAFGAAETAPSMASAPVRHHPGARGPATAPSASADVLLVSGKSGPLPRAAFGLETVIGVDERQRVVDTDAFPWRMICALQMRGPGGTGGIGTGWLIGPRTVVTAGHCVFSQTYFGGWAESVDVIPGLNHRQNGHVLEPFGKTVARRFSALKPWVESDDKAADHDIGCIHLDEPIGDRTGWFGFAALEPAELESRLVNISGYPGDLGGGYEQHHARNRVNHVGERRLFYDVDTAGGQSGAPVWIHRTEDSDPLAVAIHAYGIGATPSALGIVANSAPRILPEIYDILIHWLEMDGTTAKKAA